MLFRRRIIHNEQLCVHCCVSMKIKTIQDRVDKFEWGCMNYYCRKYQPTLSLRKGLNIFSTPTLKNVFTLKMKIPDLKNIIYNEEALIDFLLENDMVIIPVCIKCQEPMTKTNDPYKYRCNLRREREKNVLKILAYLEVVFFKTHI
jgi:hypothetical protein